jgi:hypothetical protein
VDGCGVQPHPGGDRQADQALADMATQLSSAGSNGSQAYSTLAAIAPDHGVASVEQSNAAAVESAHADLVAARNELTAAVHDAQTVVAALKAA